MEAGTVLAVIDLRQDTTASSKDGLAFSVTALGQELRPKGGRHEWMVPEQEIPNARDEILVELAKQISRGSPNPGAVGSGEMMPAR